MSPCRVGLVASRSGWIWLGIWPVRRITGVRYKKKAVHGLLMNRHLECSKNILHGQRAFLLAFPDIQKGAKPGKLQQGTFRTHYNPYNCQSDEGARCIRETSWNSSSLAHVGLAVDAVHNAGVAPFNGKPLEVDAHMPVFGVLANDSRVGSREMSECSLTPQQMATI